MICRAKKKKHTHTRNVIKFAECQKCSQRDSGQASGVLSSPGTQRRWDGKGRPSLVTDHVSS